MFVCFLCFGFYLPFVALKSCSKEFHNPIAHCMKKQPSIKLLLLFLIQGQPNNYLLFSPFDSLKTPWTFIASYLPLQSLPISFFIQWKPFFSLLTTFDILFDFYGSTVSSLRWKIQNSMQYSRCSWTTDSHSGLIMISGLYSIPFLVIPDPDSLIFWLKQDSKFNAVI